MENIPSSTWGHFPKHRLEIWNGNFNRASKEKSKLWNEKVLNDKNSNNCGHKNVFGQGKVIKFVINQIWWESDISTQRLPKIIEQEEFQGISYTLKEILHK